MNLARQLDVKVIDTVFDPDIYGKNIDPTIIEGEKLKVVYDKSSKKKALYKVWLFLSGSDLQSVASVTYQLHKSFAEPVREIERIVTNLDCRLIIWTWGIFTLNVTVKDKVNGIYVFSHPLNYGKLIERNYDKIEFKEAKVDSIPKKIA